MKNISKISSGSIIFYLLVFFFGIFISLNFFEPMRKLHVLFSKNIKKMSTEKLLTRSEIKQEDKWNVESLYESNKKWEEDFNKTKDLDLELKEFNKFKGNLSKAEAKDLKSLLEIYLSVQRRINKLHVYSHLRHDEETTDDENKGINKMCTTLYHDFDEMTSWFEPELLSLPNEVIQKFLESKELEKYKFYLEKSLHTKDHILSPQMEELISMAQNALDAPSKIYEAIDNSDFDFGYVEDGKGEKKPLSHATYGLYIRDKDRVLRKNAFVAYHKKYEEYQNTLTETLTGVVQKHYFNAKSRKYKSCLEAALFPKNISTLVYTNLIDSVRKNIDALHKYVSLRKKILGVDEIHLYDLYVPLVQVETSTFDYNYAEDVTIKSVAVLGKEYQDKLRKGLKEERWVDKYENKGKRSGAYSSGCYDSSPYILMNYNGSLNDVFTLAHEAGHSMHSKFSNENQEYHYSDYSIFVAEVASTHNEDQLRDYLLKNTSSKQDKIYLVNEAIEDIRTTFFRQVMFAEFELKIHEFVENKVPLTPKLLKEAYHELNQFYFGKDIIIDKEIDIEFARIPHFYYNFYVYQYATGISAAIFLADRVRNGGDKERNDYLNFLKGGSSKYPIDMLKVAGVDMTSGEAVEKTIERFKVLVDEFEYLLKE